MVETGKQKDLESSETLVTAEMQRGESGCSRRWHQKPEVDTFWDVHPVITVSITAPITYTTVSRAHYSFTFKIWFKT